MVVDTIRLVQSNEINIAERTSGKWRVFDEDWKSTSEESTARGIPSMLRLQERGSEPSFPIMMALRTEETV